MRPEGERGFILATMVVVLILAAAVTSGAFFAALQESRLGRSTQAVERALNAAEAGVAAIEAGWQPQWNLMATGDSLVFAPGLPTAVGSATAVLTATGAGYRVLRVRGVDPTGTAVRELATVIRVNVGPLAVPAVLTTVGPVPPSVATAVQPGDSTPPALQCPGAGALVPASAVLGSWAGGWDDWDSLAATSRAGGNGILLYDNDLTLSGATVTGIVLAAGDLTISAGTVVSGVLLVRGTLNVMGAGSRLVGVVRAGSVAVDQAALSGPPPVVFSSCIADNARRLAGVAGRLSERATADLSSGW